jgi:hypothetical protein
MNQRNELRRERALWAVKLSIPSLVKDDSLSVVLHDEGDEEVALDLSYQQDEVAFDNLAPPSPPRPPRLLPHTSTARDSLYLEAESCLQRVLAGEEELSSPIASPKQANPQWLEDGAAKERETETWGMEEEELATPYSPPSELTAGRMMRYLSDAAVETSSSRLSMTPPPYLGAAEADPLS